MTVEVEVGVDVPRDVLGNWIAQQLNFPGDGARSAEDEKSLAVLDDYEGPVTVMWQEQPGEDQE
jgi:hypothetical protein